MSKSFVRTGDFLHRNGTRFRVVEIDTPHSLLLSDCVEVGLRHICCNTSTHRFTMTPKATIIWENDEWLVHGGTVEHRIPITDEGKIWA